MDIFQNRFLFMDGNQISVMKLLTFPVY